MSIIIREIEVKSFSKDTLGIQSTDEVWYNINKTIDDKFKEDVKAVISKLGRGDKIELTGDFEKRVYNVIKIIKKSVAKSSNKPPKKTENKFVDKDSYFSKLITVEGNVIKKGTGNFAANYISWADAWNELKKIYPKSTFNVYSNSEGMPYFKDDNGAFVKVGVTVKEIEHIVFLPVMDNKFNAMKSTVYTLKQWSREKRIMVDEEVQPYTMFDINRSIQRAFAKAIAMHGMGLYVYRGEDIPE